MPAGTTNSVAPFLRRTQKYKDREGQRRRACVDLCGGRSVRIVPTATLSRRERLGCPNVRIADQPDTSRENDFIERIEPKATVELRVTCPESRLTDM
jgi:hypothetical protein